MSGDRVIVVICDIFDVDCSYSLPKPSLNDVCSYGLPKLSLNDVCSYSLPKLSLNDVCSSSLPKLSLMTSVVLACPN